MYKQHEMSFAVSWVRYTVSTTPSRLEGDIPLLDFGKVETSGTMTYVKGVVGLKVQNCGMSTITFRMESLLADIWLATASPYVPQLRTDLVSAGWQIKYATDPLTFTGDPSTWSNLTTTPVSLNAVTLGIDRIGYTQPFAIALGVPASAPKQLVRNLRLQLSFDTVDE